VLRDASTIKIMTTEPNVGEHWSNLWVVPTENSESSEKSRVLRLTTMTSPA
jgi:hypothetical protein